MKHTIVPTLTPSLAWLGVTFSLLVALSSAFNFDQRGAIVFQDPRSSSRIRESYFGYSVALYNTGAEAGIVVGAPRANSTIGSWSPSDIPEPGVLYVCPILSASPTCKEILVDPSGNGVVSQGETYQDYQNNGWLGGSLDLHRSGSSDIITTCSHRWSNQNYINGDDYFMNGACYWAVLQDLMNQNYDPYAWQKLIPLLEFAKQRITENGTVVYYYQFGQVGTSAHITQNGELLLGAPGVRQWAGTLAKVKRGEIWAPITQTTVFTPYNKYDSYLGYSVTSGRFWGTDDFLVAGAPRALPSGKVFLISTNGNGRIVGEVSGHDLGSGFGTVVAAGDVTGDRFAELFVGEPFISDYKGVNEVFESGRVVVYRRTEGQSLVPYGFLKANTQTSRARFGSAISVFGDMDRDGYQDVIVGAPYEGAGAIYIFLGSQGGINTTPAQRLEASDFSPYSLRGFGSSLSRGVDVDNNGYPDVGVGAFEGAGGAVVLRTRPVVHLEGRVTFDPEVITISGQQIVTSVCLKYKGHNVQERAAVNLEITLDEGVAEKRATFITSGNPFLAEEVQLIRDVTKCNSYVIEVKDGLKNFTKAMDVLMEYSSEDFAKDSPWCPTCGILAPGTPNSVRTSVPFVIGCGTDAICSPQLDLDARWISGATNNQYVIGSSAPLSLEVTVGVSEEPAYRGWVGVELPPGLVFKSFLYTCSSGNTRNTTCELGSPVQPPKETLILSVQEDSVEIGHQNRDLEVRVTSGALGAETQQMTLTLSLVKDVRLLLQGYAKEDIVKYDIENLKPANAEVIFQVENKGITSVSEVTVRIHIPVGYRFPEGHNLTYGEVTQVPGTCISHGFHTDVGTEGGGATSQPAGATWSVSCGTQSVICHTFECTLREATEVQMVSVQARYQLGVVLERLGNEAVISVETAAAIVTTEENIVDSGTAAVWVTLAPNGWHPPIPTSTVPVWAIIVSVLVGLLILVLIIFGLYKIGFFQRKRHEGVTKKNADPEGNADLAEDMVWEGEGEREDGEEDETSRLRGDEEGEEVEEIGGE